MKPDPAPTSQTAPTTDTSPGNKKFPVAFVNHGGGPMPLLGKQPDVVSSLRLMASKIGTPKAIVVISAHFESDVTTILTNEAPSMYYDYYGFPSDAYGYKYPAKTALEVVDQVKQLFTTNGVKYVEDNKRGFDHGVFVPLMIMYPKGDIPLICISQPGSFDPELCLKIGNALQSLREQDVLILGSGSSFHNFGVFRTNDPHAFQGSKQWDQWLRSTMQLQNISPKDRLDRIINWENAPYARLAHPREEHITPLFVVAGAAGHDKGTAIEGTKAPNSKVDLSQYIFGID